MIIDWLYWYWWILGFVLLVLEMLLPAGYVMLWMGVSALVVGALAALLPLGWQVELVLFGVISVVAFFVHHRLRPRETQSDQPTLNRRGDSYVGRSFTLGQPIVNNVGVLRVDDSQWRVSGPDTPAGTQVRVVRVEGATLVVEALP
ncbi:MAG TPA: NfeD family protein [Nevskiaceae bacterium]|nr:NfeD family protein [Nevskiaceae bacterium]